MEEKQKLKIENVSYTRLFSLGKESGNESFGLSAKIGEDENADVAVGQLFLKVMSYEDALNAYRNSFYNINRFEEGIENASHQLAYTEQEIAKRREELKRLSGKTFEELSEMEVDRNFCNAMNIKDSILRREQYKKEIEDYTEKLATARALKESLAEKIKSGNFEEAKL